MRLNQDLTLLLLAGGASRRMGRDKASIPFPSPLDPPLIQRVHDLLRPLAADCLVAGPASFELSCRLVGDAPGIAGPLGGLVAGLRGATTEYVLAVATDLPLVEPRLAQHLLVRARARRCSGAVVCRRSGQLEPLFAVYRTGAAPQLEAAAGLAPAHRGISLQLAILRLDPLVVAEAEWRRFDPQGSSFQGCNTPEELAAASLLAGARHQGGVS